MILESDGKSFSCQRCGFFVFSQWSVSVFSKGYLSSGFAMRSEWRQSSTLPPVSDVRVLPAGVRKGGNEVKALPWMRKSRKAMQDSGPDPDQEAKARRKALLEQRHLEAYRNMHRLRDALYNRYAALLKDKVHSQRLLLQQREETARAKSENETKQKQKKLAFSKLQHDDSYLTSLPKTSYYLIFDLQKQLAEHGCLKTHHDLEDFYRSIKYNHQPSQLRRSLQDVRKMMLASRSAADLSSQDRTCEKHPCAAEDRGHRDHTCNSRLLEQGSHSGVTSVELNYGGSQEKDEIEQMFPKVSVKTTGAVISFNRGSERQTHLEQ
ncbi:uncharacterized protein LOC113132209 isoform X2 [Mastacembelus armatus]|uniref:uncharacterized protein LOC113132209 isoform X2 n=1 Tax=Mastacembelus armatus TaxID=205130 RepID=UPI000E4575E3|nr:uncharacterized protein LOC113132209 isoform X2 [Mastacembelus armatus]